MPWLSIISRAPAAISSDVNVLPNAGPAPRTSKYGPTTKFGCTLAGPSVVSSAAAVKSDCAAMLSEGDFGTDAESVHEDRCRRRPAMPDQLTQDGPKVVNEHTLAKNKI